MAEQDGVVKEETVVPNVKLGSFIDGILEVVKAHNDCLSRAEIIGALEIVKIQFSRPPQPPMRMINPDLVSINPETKEAPAEEGKPE